MDASGIADPINMILAQPYAAAFETVAAGTVASALRRELGLTPRRAEPGWTKASGGKVEFDGLTLRATLGAYGDKRLVLILDRPHLGPISEDAAMAGRQWILRGFAAAGVKEEQIEIRTMRGFVTLTHVPIERTPQDDLIDEALATQDATRLRSYFLAKGTPEHVVERIVETVLTLHKPAHPDQ